MTAPATERRQGGAAVRAGAGGRRPTELAAIVHRLEAALGKLEVIGAQRCRVAAVRYDHRKVRRPPGGTRGAVPPSDGPPPLGDLFCCLPGERHDGHDFAAAARQAGAVAFICERDLGAKAGGATQLVVPAGRSREAMAHAACAVARDPASRISTIGVTGTNGKTTTAYLVSSILEAAGYAATVVGTLSGARTTPEAPDLQSCFEEARRAGSRARRPPAVAVEVTSHALVQHRVDGYVHDVAVFTNLSRDHLDYHKTMKAYFQAKRILFTPEHARRGVVNVGDGYGRRLAEEAAVEVTGFSVADAAQLVVGPEGSRFEIGRGRTVKLGLVGRFNVENALAAAAAARVLGIEDDLIADGLEAAKAPPGRLEPVENDLGISVLVDYAHTPAGLENACSTLRDLLGEGCRLLVVFGAGGDRDRAKRPRMGRQVSRLAHVAVLTSDNPRHEDPDAIIEQVRRGCDGGADLHVERDRRAAIAMALSMARRGDVVLVAGKGHETTQQVGEEMFPFDDRVVVAGEAARLAGAA